MKSKSVAIALASVLIGNSSAATKDELTLQGILSIAKMTGACGILSSMSSFQSATKLEGGNKFIERFWITEAARLGKSSEQYIEDCKRSIGAYDKLWIATEEPGK